MDIHHVLAHHSVGSMTDVAAFSALPNAPVLPERPSRLQRVGAAWRARRAGTVQTSSLRRPVAAVPSRALTAAPQPADACRMVA